MVEVSRLFLIVKYNKEGAFRLLLAFAERGKGHGSR